MALFDMGAEYYCFCSDITCSLYGRRGLVFVGTAVSVGASGSHDCPLPLSAL